MNFKFFSIVGVVKINFFILLCWIFKEPQIFVRFEFDEHAVCMRDVTSLMETIAAGGARC